MTINWDINKGKFILECSREDLEVIAASVNLYESYNDEVLRRKHKEDGELLVPIYSSYRFAFRKFISKATELGKLIIEELYK